MNPFSWWRTLRQHPVYLREKGQWGKPNPYYETLQRYSPLVIIAVAFLGVCGASGNPALLAGEQDMFAVWCLMCLPGIALSAMVLFGSLMVPALTAPSISQEVATGTWEILQVAPVSGRQIVLAKLFGALARLRFFWLVLFALSMFQGLLMVCSVSLTVPAYAVWSWLLGVSIMLRPWLEVLFAGMVGMLSSLVVRSAAMALVISYTAVLLFKLLNNPILWLLIAGWLGRDRQIALASTILPTFLYGLAVLASSILLLARADRLEYAL